MRVSQLVLNLRCERMRATKHAPRDPFSVLERRHGLAQIVEGGGRVHAERMRVIPPHPEREIMIRSKNALRDGNCFAQQRLGFFEAIYPHKGVRVVVGCNESW